MSTIHELLEKSDVELAAMTDDQLLEFLKDSIMDEPKPLPKTLVSSVDETNLIDENPIKERRKKTKKSDKEKLIAFNSFLEEL